MTAGTKRMAKATDITPPPSTSELQPGTCRYCHCEDDTPCAGGCAWTDDRQTQCTACLEAETLAEMCVRVLSVAAAEGKRPIPLVTSAWLSLSFDQKQLLVMTVKQITERLTQSIVGEIEEATRDGLIELDTIAGFLAESRAEDLVEGESISETVCRLLGKSRIIFPAGVLR